MAASDNRYTGVNTTMTFTPTGGSLVIVSTDYTEVSFEESVRVEEKTAGNEVDATFNTTIKEGKGNLKIYDEGETGISLGINTALVNSATGLFVVYPKGNVSGKAYFSCPIIVTGVKHPFAHDKNIAIEVDFIKNGAMVAPMNSLVP